MAPLAFMRGRTLNDSFIILDEAQNTSPEQMKMFLTRLGFGSRMVVTGDITQVDLPDVRFSGLATVVDILGEITDISFINFESKDVVRHKLVQKIVAAYKTILRKRQRAPRRLSKLEMHEYRFHHSAAASPATADSSTPSTCKVFALGSGVRSPGWRSGPARQRLPAGAL